MCYKAFSLKCEALYGQQLIHFSRTLKLKAIYSDSFLLFFGVFLFPGGSQFREKTNGVDFEIAIEKLYGLKRDSNGLALTDALDNSEIDEPFFSSNALNSRDWCIKCLRGFFVSSWCAGSNSKDIRTRAALHEDVRYLPT